MTEELQRESRAGRCRVFISSTYLDNKERRARVEKAVIRAGMTPVGMERFTASARPTVTECERLAAECDVYLGIIAHRYGWIPDGDSTSITELEYDAAKRAGRPRLMFELMPDVPVIPSQDFDAGPERLRKQALLEQFKRKYTLDQMPARFDEGNLSTLVRAALENLRHELDREELVALDELEALTRRRARQPSRETAEQREVRQLAIHRLSGELMRGPQLRRGDHVLDCELERVVGKGDHGTVWLARHLESGETRAVKLFDRERLALGLSLFEFRNSVRALERLAKGSCPGSVVTFFGADANRLACTMSYVSGGTLQEYLPTLGQLADKLRVFRAVCDAVGFAHDHDVLPRDLAPTRILMTAEGSPVLSRFDVADRAIAAKRRRHAPSSDIYSLGRLLQFMLIEREPGHVEGLRAQPEALVQLIQHCTQREPSKRYPLVAALVADLDAFARSVDQAQRTEPGLTPSAASPYGEWLRAGRTAVGWGAVSALAVASLSIWLGQAEPAPVNRQTLGGTTAGAPADIKLAPPLHANVARNGPAAAAGSPAAPADTSNRAVPQLPETAPPSTVGDPPVAAEPGQPDPMFQRHTWSARGAAKATTAAARPDEPSIGARSPGSRSVAEQRATEQSQNFVSNSPMITATVTVPSSVIPAPKRSAEVPKAATKAVRP